MGDLFSRPVIMRTHPFSIESFGHRVAKSLIRLMPYLAFTNYFLLVCLLFYAAETRCLMAQEHLG